MMLVQQRDEVGVTIGQLGQAIVYYRLGRPFRVLHRHRLLEFAGHLLSLNNSTLDIASFHLLVEGAIGDLDHRLTIGLGPWRQEDWDEVPDGQHDANKEQGTYPGRHALVLWAAAAAVVTLAVSVGTPEVGVGRNLVIGLNVVQKCMLTSHVCTPNFLSYR